MANPGGFGLKPFGTRGAHTDSGAQWKYFINPTSENPIYYGEPVVYENNGTDTVAGTETTGYITSIRNAASTQKDVFLTNTPIVGVFLGVRYISSNSQIVDSANPARPYWPGATLAQMPKNTIPIALVATDPNQRYLAAVDNTIATSTTFNPIYATAGYANLVFGSASDSNNGGFSTAAINGLNIKSAPTPATWAGSPAAYVAGGLQLFIDGLANPDYLPSLTAPGVPAGTQFVVYISNLVCFKFNTTLPLS